MTLAPAEGDKRTLVAQTDSNLIDVRVNAVAAGIVDTEMHLAAGDPHRAKRTGATVPIGRAATPHPDPRQLDRAGHLPAARALRGDRP